MNPGTDTLPLVPWSKVKRTPDIDAPAARIITIVTFTLLLPVVIMYQAAAAENR